MRLLARILAATAVFVLATAILGAAVFSALSSLFACPPAHPACDLPDMAAFAIAGLAAPLLGVAVAVGIDARFLKPRAGGMGTRTARSSSARPSR